MLSRRQALACEVRGLVRLVPAAERQVQQETVV